MLGGAGGGVQQSVYFRRLEPAGASLEPRWRLAGTPRGRCSVRSVVPTAIHTAKRRSARRKQAGRRPSVFSPHAASSGPIRAYPMPNLLARYNGVTAVPQRGR